MAEDVQFEAVMIDPYIRRNFKPTGSNLTVEFKVPDHYGLFTFKVAYSKRGLSNLLATETVQIRPLRHDQYARFITVAYPYYFNIFGMMILFFIFTAVFLFNSDVQKVKTE